MDETQLLILHCLADSLADSREGLTVHEICDRLNFPAKRLHAALPLLVTSGYLEVTKLGQRLGGVELIHITPSGIEAIRQSAPTTVINVQGDVVTTVIGDNAQNVTAGKNIELPRKTSTPTGQNGTVTEQ
jgi:hypothetical protein